jgi:hypothetical protein
MNILGWEGLERELVGELLISQFADLLMTDGYRTSAHQHISKLAH